jgi:hypothetical protein
VNGMDMALRLVPLKQKNMIQTLEVFIVNNIKNIKNSKLLFGFTGNGDLFLPKEEVEC